MSRTRILDRYNLGVFVLRDETQSENELNRRGIMGCEISNYYDNKSDIENYGDITAHDVGYISGFSFWKKDQKDKKVGVWHSAPVAVIPFDDQATFKTLVGDFEKKVKEDYPLKARGSQVGTVQRQITIPGIEDAPIPMTVPHLIFDGRYALEVGPMVLNEAAKSSSLAHNGSKGFGSLRTLLGVCRTPGGDPNRPISQTLSFGNDEETRLANLKKRADYNLELQKKYPTKHLGSGLSDKDKNIIQKENEWNNSERDRLLKEFDKQFQKYDKSEAIGLELGESPDGGWGFGMIKWGDTGKTSSLAQLGPSKGFITGYQCVRHAIGGPTGGGHTPAHISTEGYYFMDPDRDGVLDFEEVTTENEGGNGGSKKKVHLQWFEEKKKWVWWTTDTLEKPTVNAPSTPAGGKTTEPSTPVTWYDAPEFKIYVPPVFHHGNPIGGGNPVFDNGRKINGPNNQGGKNAIKDWGNDWWTPKGAEDGLIPRDSKQPPASNGPKNGLKPSSDAPYIPIPGSGSGLTEVPPRDGGRNAGGYTYGIPTYNGWKTGYAPGGSKTQQSFPSIEGQSNSSSIGSPGGMRSNAEYQAGNYNHEDYLAGKYSGDPMPDTFTAADWFNLEQYNNSQKQGKVLTYTLAGFALENTDSNELITTNDINLKFRVPATKGGAFFAPAECNNQDVNGSSQETLSHKAQLLLHETRSELAFGLPRQTEKIILKYANDVLEMDMSGCSGLKLTGLPTSDPGGSDLVWNDGGNLAITI